jgi:hypothetical protein
MFIEACKQSNHDLMEKTLSTMKDSSLYRVSLEKDYYQKHLKTMEVQSMEKMMEKEDYWTKLGEPETEGDLAEKLKHLVFNDVAE